MARRKTSLIYRLIFDAYILFIQFLGQIPLLLGNCHDLVFVVQLMTNTPYTYVKRFKYRVNPILKRISHLLIKNTKQRLPLRCLCVRICLNVNNAITIAAQELIYYSFVSGELNKIVRKQATNYRVDIWPPTVKIA